MLLLATAGLTSLSTSLAFILIFPLLLLFAIVSAHEHGNMLPGIRMEFRVESLFVRCGVLAALWAGLSSV